jgi:asparagine synthase (glutamine-hydrolysing)
MAGLSKSQPVRTAAIGFADKRFNELEYARMVAERYQTDHSEFVVKPDAVSILERLVWHFDEPFADSSAIPTWYVSQMARQKVTVALSGDGGDETFAGYTQRYSMNRFEDVWRQRVPDVLREGLLGPLAKIYPRADWLPRPLRLKAFLTNLSLPVELAYFRDMSFYFKPEAKQRLLKRELANTMGDADPAEVLGRHFDRNRNPDVTSRVQYVDIKTYLPEDILVKVDRMSMAHSLEVRAPILDHKVMEFAARLPSSLKLNGDESKYMFKKMNERRLPGDVLYRKKQGFCVPLASWLRSDLKALAHDAVFGESADLREWFDMSYVTGVWDRHQSGREDNATPLWGLVMLGLWKKMVMSW